MMILMMFSFILLMIIMMMMMMMMMYPAISELRILVQLNRITNTIMDNDENDDVIVPGISNEKIFTGNLRQKTTQLNIWDLKSEN